MEEEGDGDTRKSAQTHTRARALSTKNGLWSSARRGEKRAARKTTSCIVPEEKGQPWRIFFVGSIRYRRTVIDGLLV